VRIRRTKEDAFVTADTSRRVTSGISIVATVEEAMKGCCITAATPLQRLFH